MQRLGRVVARALCKRRRWYALMNVKVIAAILLIAAAPVCAQAQSQSVPKVSKGDAEKVASIISSDKAKTQTYCDLMKVGEQIGQAYHKKDRKKIAELSHTRGRMRSAGELQ